MQNHENNPNFPFKYVILLFLVPYESHTGLGKNLPPPTTGQNPTPHTKKDLPPPTPLRLRAQVCEVLWDSTNKPNCAVIVTKLIVVCANASPPGRAPPAARGSSLPPVPTSPAAARSQTRCWTRSSSLAGKKRQDFQAHF